LRVNIMSDRLKKRVGGANRTAGAPTLADAKSFVPGPQRFDVKHGGNDYRCLRYFCYRRYHRLYLERSDARRLKTAALGAVTLAPADQSARRPHATAMTGAYGRPFVFMVGHIQGPHGQGASCHAPLSGVWWIPPAGPLRPNGPLMVGAHSLDLVRFQVRIRRRYRWALVLLFCEL
jgi:hypothetical protein